MINDVIFSGINGDIIDRCREIHSSLAHFTGMSKVRGCRTAAVELAEVQSISFNGWIRQC